MVALNAERPTTKLQDLEKMRLGLLSMQIRTRFRGLQRLDPVFTGDELKMDGTSEPDNQHQAQ